MLKNISPILSPELLKILMEMGHGDEIVIGDGNFPAASIAQRLVRLDGHGVPEILDAILRLMPLDTYVDAPVALMDNGDRAKKAYAVIATGETAIYANVILKKGVVV